MSVFPLTQPVGRIRASTGTDEMGNTVPLPGDPDNPDEVLVFAWWVSSSGEIDLGEHQERVTADAAIICEVGAFVPSDQVVLPGYGLFEVQGKPENYDANPWWSPSRDVILLRQAL